ncbi:MAG: hypothetical protein ACMUIP_14725 [bacterium]
MKNLVVKMSVIIFCIVYLTALPLLSGNSVCTAQEVVRTTQSSTSSTQATKEDEKKTQAETVSSNAYANFLASLPTTASRTQSWYKKETQTTPIGGTATQWSYGADLGWGETGSGFSYTNPLTGATVTYSTTGYAMGTVAAPIYGGAQSIFGQGTYGPLLQTAATGKAPQTSPTIGWTTQTSQAGNLFGTGYTYTAAQPDYGILLATQLTKNPSTQALGNVLLGLSTINWVNAATSYLAQPSYGYYTSQPYYGYPTTGAYGIRY